jgi:hypothetical protein
VVDGIITAKHGKEEGSLLRGGCLLLLRIRMAPQKGALFVLMPHLLFQFSVFVFPDFFSSLFYNASHPTKPPTRYRARFRKLAQNVNITDVD